MISYTAEMQLRALIRENIVDLIDADPLSEEIISVTRRLIRETATNSGFPCKGNTGIKDWWDGVSGWDIADYVFSAIGLGASILSLVGGGPVLTIVALGAAGIGAIINGKQAWDQFSRGNYGEGAWEIMELAVSLANFHPGLAAGGAIGLIPEIASLVLSVGKDLIDCFFIADDDPKKEEEKKKLEQQVAQAVTKAQTTRGSTKPPKVIDMDKIICDFIVDVPQELSKEELGQFMIAATDIDLTFITNDVFFKPIYAEYKRKKDAFRAGDTTVCGIGPRVADMGPPPGTPTSPQPTNGSGSSSPRRSPGGKNVDRELSGVARAFKKTGSLEGMYKFAPGDGTIIFIDDDLDDGVRHNPVMLQKSARDMKRGEKIEGSALTFHSMSYDDRGRVATVKFRSPNGTILDVPPTSRYKPPAPDEDTAGDDSPEEDAR